MLGARAGLGGGLQWHPEGRWGRKPGRRSVSEWCTGLEVFLTALVHIPLCELCFVTWPDRGNSTVSFSGFRDNLWGTRGEEMCHQWKGLLWRSQVAVCFAFWASSKEEKLAQDHANKYLLICCLNWQLGLNLTTVLSTQSHRNVETASFSPPHANRSMNSGFHSRWEIAKVIVTGRYFEQCWLFVFWNTKQAINLSPWKIRLWPRGRSKLWL